MRRRSAISSQYTPNEFSEPWKTNPTLVPKLGKLCLLDLFFQYAEAEIRQNFVAQRAAEIEEHKARRAEFAQAHDLFDGLVGAKLAFHGGNAKAFIDATAGAR